VANNTTSLGFNVFARNLASRTFKKIADDADGMAARLDKAGSIAVAAGAGLSVLTPILGGAVVAAGGLAAPLAAAGAGAIALKAVAQPAFEDIAEAMKLQEQAAKGSEAAAAELEKVLADMSPAARTLMKDWQGLTAEYDEWAKSLQPEVLPLFSRGIDMVSGRIEKLNPLVRGSAGAVDSLLDSLDKSLSSPFWDQFGERMTRLAPTAIEGLGRTGGNVAGGVAGIIHAFMPAAPGMLRIVEDISAGFRSWGMGLDGSPAFRKFMDYVASSGPQVLTIIRNLGSVIGMLIAGLEPFVGLAPLMTGALSVLSSMLARVDPVVLEAIGTAIGGVVLAWKAWTVAQWALNTAMLANPIGAVILVVVALGAGLVLAWKRSERFRDVVTGTWNKVQASAETVSDFFTGTVWPSLVDGWTDLTDAAGPAADRVIGWLRNLRDGAATFSGIWDTAWSGARRKVKIFADAVGPIAEDGFDVLKGSFRFFIALLEGDWAGAWDEAKGVVSSGFSAWKRISATQLKLWKSSLRTWFVELPSSVREWMADNIPVIKAQLKEWGVQFTDWAQEMTPEVLKRLQGLGTRIGQWMTTDLPPLIEEKTKEWTQRFTAWARDLPGRVAEFLSDAQRVQEAIQEWGPKLGIALVAAVAIAVLAVPTALATLGAMFLIVLGSIAQEVHSYLVARATEWVLGVSEKLRLGVDQMVGWFRSLPSRIYAYFQELYDDLVGHSIVPDTVRDIIMWFDKLPSAIRAIVTRAKDWALAQVTGLRDGTIGRVETLRSKGVSALKGFATGAVKAFSTAVKGIRIAWGAIEGIAKAPIRFVVNTVYNRALVPLTEKIASKIDGVSALKRMSLPKGFRKGGILAGQSTWRQGDDQLIAARKGEGIAISEAMQVPALRSELLTWNKVGVSGGTSALRRYAEKRGQVAASPSAIAAGQPPLAGFAKGGLVGGWLKDKWDSIAGRAKSWATGPLNAMTDALSGRYGRGDDFNDIPYHLMRGVKSKLLGHLGRADAAHAQSMAGGADSWVGLGSASDRLRKAAQFARAQHGKPYIWGGAGPRGYDCSGFTGAVENVIRGVGPHFRRYSTHSFRGNSAPAGWVRGLKSPYSVGITHAGVGHTAGTLMGVDIESRGSAGVVIGSRARGARNGLFSSVYGFAPVAGDKAAQGKAKGGIVSYDQGGMLQPGLNLAYNGTGKPEPVGHGLVKEVRIIIDLEGGDEDLKRRIRKITRVEGGGDVQVAFGKGGRG
jgi:phage-related protein